MTDGQFDGQSLFRGDTANGVKQVVTTLHNSVENSDLNRFILQNTDYCFGDIPDIKGI